MAELEISTEKEYDRFVKEKIKEGETGYLRDFRKKEILKRKGIPIKYRTFEGEVYYSYTVCPKPESIFR